MKFPTTTAEFVADQERRAGRDIEDENLIECISVWVPLFNCAFEDGKRKDTEALMKSLRFIDEHRSPTDSDFLTHWLDAARRWIITAWQQGVAAG